MILIASYYVLVFVCRAWLKKELLYNYALNAYYLWYICVCNVGEVVVLVVLIIILIKL